MKKKPKMIYTVLDQVLGYLVLIGRGVEFKGRLRFYGDNVWIHIHQTTTRFIMRAYPAQDLMITGYPTSGYIRGLERPVSGHEDRTAFNICFPDGTLTLTKRNKPGRERPYFSLSGSKKEVYAFLSSLVN
jgi:hypothetical protein